jgi:hypothetical protein
VGAPHRRDRDRCQHEATDVPTCRQVEGFADTILPGAQQAGANAHDGLAAVRALVAIGRSLGIGDAVRLADVVGAV